MLYVNDGAFAFEASKDTEIGSNLIFQHLNCFGLQMHIVSKSKLSKTECVFSCAPGHFKPAALPTYSSSSLPVTLKKKKENGGTNQKRYDQKYDGAEETEPILIGESGMITLTRHFKYIGSYISYSLKDDYDIEHRISQDSSAMGSLNNFWIDNTVDNISKYLIFCAIPCNILLWGCESWEIREATLNKLEVFLHRNVRKILKITITMVMDEKITNQYLRKIFFNIPTIRNQIAK